MKRFAQLYEALDSTTSTTAKTQALVAYFQSAPPEDAAWALYFLAGGKPKQTVPTAVLRATARAHAKLPEWLFDESYDVVGDLAETIAHILPPAAQETDVPLHRWMQERLLSLRGRSPESTMAALQGYWDELDTPGRFLLTKLIGGGFRVGVARNLVLRALAQATGLNAKHLAQRLMGYTDKQHVPNAASFQALSDPASPAQASGQPYPFFLAHALQQPPDSLGPIGDWLVEWKWDGIRAQFIKRPGEHWLWSRGEDLLSGRFPELDPMADLLPDHTVLDGEIVVWLDGRVQPFAALQKRIGRKTLGKAILAECPVAFLAYDLLEYEGEDCRPWPQWQRRQQLEALIAAPAILPASSAPLQLSPLVSAPDWATLATWREESRSRGVEGFMLKRRDSQYGTGRTKDVGLWWKWKVDPHSIDAVLIYAQSGHGRRANLYTDYTFAVWDGDADTPGAPRRLVPFAKAYSGLTDDEMRQVDQRIRQTTLEKFGPVRSVTPTLVVELGFEAIQASKRHKSGLAVRFPRMLRLRWDKPVDEADTLATLRGLIQAPQGQIA